MQHLFQTIVGQSILITGGAGYIGRIATTMLEHWGCTVWVLDDLSGSAAPFHHERFFQGSILDTPLLKQIFSQHHFDAVIHLAAKINVGESIDQPDLYWLHNVIGTERLIEHIPSSTKVLFASSAAVYGTHSTKVTEQSTCAPTSPYGEGKLAAETLLAKNPHQNISFRLFNVAGSIEHPLRSNLTIGEEHSPETHLIPRIIQQHLQGLSFSVFGNEHPTPDGTCIREYIHVLDVVHAFAHGLVYLKTQQSAPKDNIFNITSGKGHSVIEVLNQLSNEGVTFGQPPVQYHFTKARPGDPSHITGDPSLANEVLQWHPRHSDLQTIALSAWKHQLKLNLSIDYSA